MGSVEGLRRRAVGEDRFSTPRTPPFPRVRETIREINRRGCNHPKKGGRKRPPGPCNKRLLHFNQSTPGFFCLVPRRGIRFRAALPGIYPSLATWGAPFPLSFCACSLGGPSRSPALRASRPAGGLDGVPAPLLAAP